MFPFTTFEIISDAAIEIRFFITIFLIIVENIYECLNDFINRHIHYFKY